jgi:hypothetical protein
MLVQVTCNRFCAGAILKDDHIAEAAPVLSFTIGWHRTRFVTYFRRRYCKVEPVW